LYHFKGLSEGNNYTPENQHGPKKSEEIPNLKSIKKIRFHISAGKKKILLVPYNHGAKILSFISVGYPNRISLHSSAWARPTPPDGQEWRDWRKK